ncbi:hypothetical protein FA95DRAFT_1498188 [Auriscalpium vulgare]|uniref:Uncharacterized protein n=1 Tax=Auriscalpium vulgare TaxID=40419 RepID=A0ACB8RJ31_9AGAM|nr:hypothetical protein FA95DRAFT_1498188 [Auriscalpium vulgare]
MATKAQTSTILPQPFAFIRDAIVTGFLFTKSDIKTTLIPVTFFAVASATDFELSRLVHVMAWIWLHLLQFDVSNQTLSEDEDGMNKTDRPLPSGRMTLRSALILRWLLVPVCWIYSAFYSVEVVYASIALVALTVIYDEMGAHAGHYIVRNLVNAGGFASFEAGSTLIAGSDRHSLDGVGILAIAISAGIFATTIQAQDFKDRDGDGAIGRQTIPLVLPSIARYTVIIPLLLWSTGLSVLWRLDAVAGCTFVALATFVGVRFLGHTSIPEDQVSFYWYNVWLSAAHSLPGYYRLFRGI